MVEVPVESTFALRERLLRADRPDLPVRMSEDDVAGAFHLAVLREGDAVGVVSVSPAEPDFPVTAPAYRLRQMAVRPDVQGLGIGAALVAGVGAVLRSRGDVATLWAESRDTSLGFYLAQGMRIVPDSHHAVGEVGYTNVVAAVRPTQTPGKSRW